ncbi:MAG: Protein phosphatase 2C 1 [Chrysothrix sp. TS-e1954]|nr:MAG: Protein phosphatase 2C 1 [Chrysothrix sp. TS-e1954]
MFGSSSSPPKDNESAIETSSPSSRSSPSMNIPDGSSEGNVRQVPEMQDSPMGRKSEESPGTSPTVEKRSRRTSGIKEMFSSARNSLHLSGSPTRNSQERIPQTPIQKLGKTDPALGVPQGSLNNAAGESVPGPRSTFRVGVTEDKNKKCRRTMEDTHAYLYNFLSTPAPAISENVSRQRSGTTDSQSSKGGDKTIVETDNGYFAIFDGHAGTFAAEWCGKKLHILLEDTIRRNPNKAIPELLDETFTNVDQQLEKLPLKNSGCTAVIAVLRWEDRIPNNQSATGSSSIAPATAEATKTKAESQSHENEESLRTNASRQRVLYTANVGDARIVLCRNGKALRLSYDHKGSDDNEGKRIANAGGLILNNRVNGVLAVTRALGDAYMKDLVTGHPYTTETVIQPEIDEFMILACDGLWDVCSDQEAVDLIRSNPDPQSASKTLVDHALGRFSTDNLSCMIVRFNSQALQATVERRAEPLGVEGDPASTVEGGISETEAIVGAARKNLHAAGGDGEDLARVSTDMILEEDQEAGPELDPEGLKKAKEKAHEGKKAEERGGNATGSS